MLLSSKAQFLDIFDQPTGLRDGELLVAKRQVKLKKGEKQNLKFLPDITLKTYLNYNSILIAPRCGFN